MSTEREEHEWYERVRTELLPKLELSTMIAVESPSEPDKPDIKLAVELGLALWLNKPVIIAVQPGRDLPHRVRRCADIVLDDCDIFTDEGQERFYRAVETLNDGI